MENKVLNIYIEIEFEGRYNVFESLYNDKKIKVFLLSNNGEKLYIYRYKVISKDVIDVNTEQGRRYVVEFIFNAEIAIEKDINIEDFLEMANDPETSPKLLNDTLKTFVRKIVFSRSDNKIVIFYYV